MQTLRKKTSPCKFRNDPGRFFGDGVQFKAKLIGILEVGEARGDRMCQEALQDLKMAIRAAGEHKQRITIHVTIDGLRLRDEKTGDSQYHHPVHKISFIAQDMSDSRAFGYIFGSPDSGHRFFGIKTDKAASQVVLAMRDLFQVVFELKKKEIELARQQIQSKSIHEHQLASLSSLKSGGAPNEHGSSAAGTSLTILTSVSAAGSSGISRLGVNLDTKGAAKEMSPESVADLVDLEQELSSIQRGITQMERITPSDPLQPSMGATSKTATDEDPFGDSFTHFPSYNLLPPPESGRSRHKPHKSMEPSVSGIQLVGISTLLSPAPLAGTSPTALQADDDDNWLHELDHQNDMFDIAKSGGIGISVGMPMAPLAASESTSTPTQQLSECSALADVELSAISSGEASTAQQADLAQAAGISDAFTDLDPLGIGRTRPYVDKKYFFQELKNPPKKVLKELSCSASGYNGPSDAASSHYTAAASVVDEFLSKEGLFDDTVAGAPSETTSGPVAPSALAASVVEQQQPLNVTNATNINNTADPAAPTAVAGADPVMLPRDTDPFSPTRKKSDPFQEGDIFSQLDPFEFEFPGKGDAAQRISPTASAAAATDSRRSADIFNGPLQVNLPPEGSVASPTSAQWKERHGSESSSTGGAAGGSTVRSRPTASGQMSSGAAAQSSVFKQQTVDVISSISNKKMPHLFGQARFSKRDSNSINMRRLQESDSLSENETAPEPPPRPESAMHVEPPPLPPKKQCHDIIIRPRVTTIVPIVPVISSNRYEFINTAVKLPTRSPSSAPGGDVPPIPLPSRRVGRSDGTYPGPGRPRKPGHTEDDYLAPIGVGAGTSASAAAGDVPPLLPPPSQSSTRARAQRQQSVPKAQEIYENKTEILQQQQQQQQQQTSKEGASILPDITLSQLLTLGIDELAAKLSVPTSKLSTMTLVELTSYLSEFIEKSKPASKPIKQRTQPISPATSGAVMRPESQTEQPPVFKVHFTKQATFVAKFDDTFGEEIPAGRKSSHDSFVANFAQFNEPPAHHSRAGHATHSSRTPAVPPADRYAVFREIIDQELQHQQQNADLMGDLTPPNEEITSEATKQVDAKQEHEAGSKFATNYDEDGFLTAPQNKPPPPPPKIDTKITQVVAQAKDRYAALRDIILVENLFEKKSLPPEPRQEKNLMQEFPEFIEEFTEDQDIKQIMDDDRASSAGPDRLGFVDSCGLPAEPSSSALTVADDDDEDEDGGAESSLDSNDKDLDAARGEMSQLPQDQYKKLSTSNQQLDMEKAEKAEAIIVADVSKPNLNLPNAKQDGKFLTVSGASGLSASKDDLEIDELMQRAISNLSLDSRERISPANSASAPISHSFSPAVMRPSEVRSATLTTQAQFNDVSTSPILQKSPVPPQSRLQQKSPLSKSPIPVQLSAISNLIDTATKQMGSVDLLSEPEIPSAASKTSKESWATFDSPKPGFLAEAGDKHARRSKSVKSTTLHLPPPPPSNTSQNDTAESPCSSDPRDDGWGKRESTGVRRWAKKERHQTSSSSRDLSPWDDEAPEYQKQKRIVPAPPLQPGQQHGHADRHGYYMRHPRRMNSCDEDYDYEEEFTSRRDHRKFKQGISRSRDNFDLDSPSWYHHQSHHSWSPQEVEQSAAARARSFERSAYERTTYGPPIYDKRGVALPPSGGPGYDRRSGYDKRKYYREYTRPNYDFDEYGESPPMPERYPGSFEKLKLGRRSDYENVYDDGRSPIGYKSRADYMYERERKSFDRESVESFESTSRRRRSFGSGEVYGSLESREDFRERYMGGAEKTRSLRKSMKLRATGDIDYEQDSETDFHQRQRGVAPEARSLQRPSQLTAGTSGGGIGMSGPPTRMRKSSGSSPWDGEEPPLPGQKSWKRPASAAESERRLAESRRAAALGQTPSGSDGEKERRFRKKQRSRAKELPSSSAVASGATSGSRYGNPINSHARDNYDYITYQDDDDIDDDYVDEDYDEPPTDEDKFERLNRRRHEMHQRMMESERRQHSLAKVPTSTFKSAAPSGLSSSTTTAPAKKYHSAGRSEYDFDDYEQTPTPRSNVSAAGSASGGSAHPSGGGGGSKFSFDAGFESDFNQRSPATAPAATTSSCTSTPAATVSATTTPATKSSFRFSNDFSERDKLQTFTQNSTSASSLQQLEAEGTSPAPHATPPIMQKLRFDDNVKVSQFDDAAFEDDFSKQFDFEKEDQWHAESLQMTSSMASKKHSLRNSKLQQRQELIKKSESINIFVKKTEDPFEDDEFFNTPTDAKPPATDNGGAAASASASASASSAAAAAAPTADSAAGKNFQWDDDRNFAKFDENM